MSWKRRKRGADFGETSVAHDVFFQVRPGLFRCRNRPRRQGGDKPRRSPPGLHILHRYFAGEHAPGVAEVRVGDVGPEGLGGVDRSSQTGGVDQIHDLIISASLCRNAGPCRSVVLGAKAVAPVKISDRRPCIRYNCAGDTGRREEPACRPILSPRTERPVPRNKDAVEDGDEWLLRSSRRAVEFLALARRVGGINDRHSFPIRGNEKATANPSPPGQERWGWPRFRRRTRNRNCAPWRR